MLRNLQRKYTRTVIDRVYGEITIRGMNGQKKGKEENSQTPGTAGTLNGDSLQAHTDRRLHYLGQSVAGRRGTPERVDMRYRREMVGY